MTVALRGWLDRVAAGRPVVLTGGDLDRIVERVFALSAADVAVLCRRELSDAISMEAVLSRVPKPAVFITRGLVKDSFDVPPKVITRHLFVEAAIIADYHAVRLDHLSKINRLLCGYDVDADLLDRYATDDAMRLAARFGSGRSLPLVFIDQAGQLPADLLDRSTLMALEPPPSRARLLPLDRTGSVLPSQRLVAAHARFLAETDLPTLRSMHGDVGERRYSDLFSIWRQNLIELQKGHDGREYVPEALAKLGSLEAELDMVRPPA